MKPVIGERYRDTAREIAGVTHLERFRATRQLDAEREDILMRAIIQRARKTDAAVVQIVDARHAGIAELRAHRSVARAIAAAIAKLRQPSRPA